MNDENLNASFYEDEKALLEELINVSYTLLIKLSIKCDVDFTKEKSYEDMLLKDTLRIQKIKLRKINNLLPNHLK